MECLIYGVGTAELEHGEGSGCFRVGSGEFGTPIGGGPLSTVGSWEHGGLGLE